MPTTEYVTTGVIRKGKLKIRSSEIFLRQLANMKDGEVTIAVTRSRAARNLVQNALYWSGFVAPISEYTGYSSLAIHQYLKKKFLQPERIHICDRRDGVILDETDLEPTTTRLTIAEFSAYLNAISEWVMDTFEGQVVVGSTRGE